MYFWRSAGANNGRSVAVLVDPGALLSQCPVEQSALAAVHREVVQLVDRYPSNFRVLVGLGRFTIKIVG